MSNDDTPPVQLTLYTSPTALTWIAEVLEQAVRMQTTTAGTSPTAEMLARRKANVFADAARIVRNAAKRNGR